MADWFKREEYKTLRICICNCGNKYNSQAREITFLEIQKYYTMKSKEITFLGNLSKFPCPKCKRNRPVSFS